MKTLRLNRLFALMGASLFIVTSAARSQTLFHVSIDTAQLANHPAEPFSLQLVLGNGTDGFGSSSVIVSNINLGTGDSAGDPDTDGDVSGDLTSSISMDDLAGEAEFSEQFTPGSTLTFDVYATLSLETNGVPDEFTIAILDSEGERIPSLDDLSGNVLVRFTTDDGMSVSATGYSTDASLDPTASGPPLAFGPLVVLDGTMPPPVPALGILSNGDGTATVQWLAGDSSLFLQSSIDLQTWSIVPVAPVNVITNYQILPGFSFSLTNSRVTVEMISPGMQFFRLAQ